MHCSADKNKYKIIIETITEKVYYVEADDSNKAKKVAIDKVRGGNKENNTHYRILEIRKQ
jgi:hypothetical protein